MQNLKAFTKYDRNGYIDMCAEQGWLNSSEADGLAVGRQGRG